jgi:16S rRNA (guanine966-N2)-methyltransferase
MRVIAGSARGTVLKTIEGMATRPTVDRVKEALFSSIQFNIRDAHCLDAFAGSGALGIEALSRGASHVVFVDAALACHKVIVDNLLKTRFTERSTLMKGDILEVIKRYNGSPFDLVFLDPPYGKGMCKVVMEALIAKNLLSGGAMILVEHDHSEVLDDHYGVVHKSASKKYGNTYITKYEVRECL